jgi:2-polyprenyl-3-methyl-5-hydroxy-6-metoxy-1,4-benzoquinol methylase
MFQGVREVIDRPGGAPRRGGVTDPRSGFRAEADASDFGAAADAGDPAFRACWMERIEPRIPAALSGVWWAFAAAGIARGQEIVRVVGQHIDPRGARVLDAGCGFGGTSIAFARAGARVQAVDFDHDYVRAARARAAGDRGRADACFHQASVTDLPFGAGTFDVVVCADVLEHVASQERTIAEIARVLRRGGMTYLSFPNRLSPHNLVRDPHYHLPGISVLPRRWASACVSILRPSADRCCVWSLPIASRVVSRLHRDGLRVVRVQRGSTAGAGNRWAVLDAVRLDTCNWVELIAVNETRGARTGR